MTNTKKIITAQVIVFLVATGLSFTAVRASEVSGVLSSSPTTVPSGSQAGGVVGGSVGGGSIISGTVTGGSGSSGGSSLTGSVLGASTGSTGDGSNGSSGGNQGAGGSVLGAAALAALPRPSGIGGGSESAQDDGGSIGGDLSVADPMLGAVALAADSNALSAEGITKATSTPWGIVGLLFLLFLAVIIYLEWSRRKVMAP